MSEDSKESIVEKIISCIVSVVVGGIAVLGTVVVIVKYEVGGLLGEWSVHICVTGVLVLLIPFFSKNEKTCERAIMASMMLFVLLKSMPLRAIANI